MIVIDSEWCETPLKCPDCGPEYILYSDGLQRPQCPKCFYVATEEEILASLVYPTPDELAAKDYAFEMRQALDRVREILADGRTVGHDQSAAALEAENFILEILGR